MTISIDIGSFLLMHSQGPQAMFAWALSGYDSISGSPDTDTLLGFDGNDTMDGGGGGDRMEGGAGDNVLKGLGGADSIAGGLGTDILTGGADNDRFVFPTTADSAVGAAHDVITDFKPGKDKLDLSANDANTATGVDNAFAFSGTTPTAHGMWWVVSGSDILVRVDVDGVAGADFEVLIQGIGSLAPGDVVL